MLFDLLQVVVANQLASLVSVSAPINCAERNRIVSDGLLATTVELEFKCPECLPEANLMTAGCRSFRMTEINEALPFGLFLRLPLHHRALPWELSAAWRLGLVATRYINPRRSSSSDNALALTNLYP